LQKAEKERHEKLEQQRAIHPSRLFITQTDKYSCFDGDGLPTADQDGNPLSKSALKKVAKQYEKQKELYENYKKSVNK
jgi:hypothetical protein